MSVAGPRHAVQPPLEVAFFAVVFLAVLLAGVDFLAVEVFLAGVDFFAVVAFLAGVDFLAVEVFFAGVAFFVLSLIHI